ncbi:MAG: hypothetical protein WCS94_15375 [Verrucomicrobiota bacterium]
MKKPVKKTQKVKPQSIKIIAERPGRIKTALKSWVTAAEKTDCDALNLNGAPAWAENALAEFAKITLPGKRLPTEGECDVEFIGELIGRQFTLANMLTGQIPMGTAMQAEAEKLLKHAARMPMTPKRAAREKLLAKDFKNNLAATSQTIPNLMAAMLASSPADALKFQAGLTRGMNLAPDELTTGKTFQRHTRIFYVLGTQWRSFLKCRSVAEVHRILCAAIGEKNIGILKHFEERVAKKIGMKFGKVGRPSKPK